jgi:hypothetical protein
MVVDGGRESDVMKRTMDAKLAAFSISEMVSMSLFLLQLPEDLQRIAARALTYLQLLLPS